LNTSLISHPPLIEGELEEVIIKNPITYPCRCAALTGSTVGTSQFLFFMIKPFSKVCCWSQDQQLGVIFYNWIRVWLVTLPLIEGELEGVITAIFQLWAKVIEVNCCQIV